MSDRERNGTPTGDQVLTPATLCGVPVAVPTGGDHQNAAQTAQPPETIAKWVTSAAPWRAWWDQYRCGTHSVSFRGSTRPNLCPVGEAAERIADAIRALDDEEAP